MNQTVKHSVAPIYLVGATWLAFALFFHLYLPVDYITCALLSVAVFLIGRALFPDRVVQAEDTSTQKAESARPADDGAITASAAEAQANPEIASLLKERDRALSEMRRLNDAIEDPKISEQIDHLGSVTAKIINLVAESPAKLPQIRRFMDYYLPTTLKILNAYDRMGNAGIRGSNIDTTREKITGMMDTIVLAFDRQLDSLFSDEALDISTDITVMEKLLAQEGLDGTKPDVQPEQTDDEIQLKL